MNKISTTDIYFCAALLSIGGVLDTVDRTDPKHMIFSVSLKIPDTLPVGQTIDDYNMSVLEKAWANETLRGNLFRMASAIKRLKSVVHANP